MSMLEKAIELAARAHAGQVDKAGEPYILLPLRLMFSVTGENERITAILHDIVEDTTTTLADLRALGFPEDVVTAVDALTKRKGETRIEAAARAAENSIARAVKLADVTHNMDLSRIPSPTPKDLDRMKQYEQVRAILLAKG